AAAPAGAALEEAAAIVAEAGVAAERLARRFIGREVARHADGRSWRLRAGGKPDEGPGDRLEGGLPHASYCRLLLALCKFAAAQVPAGRMAFFTQMRPSSQ